MFLCSEPGMRIGEEYQAAVPDLEEGMESRSTIFCMANIF